MGSYRVFSRSRSCAWRVATSALVSALALGLVSGIALARVANAEKLNADQLKAAYLYNFARYVEWPGDAHASGDSPVKIGVVGSSAVSSLLKKTVEGKSVGSRKLEVVELDAAAEGRDSHILFVAGELSADDLESTVSELSGTPVFVIADDENFARKGGVANFFVADQRVRFAINKGAAEKSRLKVSSKLLRLAELVD